LAAFGERFGNNDAEPSPMMEAMTRELPIGKFVIFGALAEDDLQRMIEQVNGNVEPDGSERGR
jgi:hypothetical protein